MNWGKHNTIPPGTNKAVRWLQAQPDVRRLILGPYRPKRKARSEVNVIGPCRGGLQLLARGDDLALEMFVHTADPEALASRIKGRFA